MGPGETGLESPVVRVRNMAVGPGRPGRQARQALQEAARAEPDEEILARIDELLARPRSQREEECANREGPE